MSEASLTTWRLEWKGPLPGGPRAWVDGAALRPDRLAPLRLEEVLATPVRLGARLCAAGELFGVTAAGEPEDGPALIVAGSPRLVRLGSGMAAGRIEVHGHGGELCGSGLAGGTIVVRGDTGDGLGCGMTGGRIVVEGNAGDFAGGAAGSEPTGLRGGEIAIHGDAGAGAGFRMRRGLLAIAGRCGPLAGHGMLAGTIVLGRGGLRQPGVHLRRGSILALAPGLEPAVGFRCEGTARPGWLRLLRSCLDELGFRWPEGTRSRLESGAFTAWSGDELFGSRGEVLVPAEGP